VMTRPRWRLVGVSTRSTPAEAECTQAIRGARRSTRSKASGREEATEQDLDVVERAVGEALRRDGDEPGPGRRLADALEVASAPARRQDRAQRDRGRDAVRTQPRARRRRCRAVAHAEAPIADRIVAAGGAVGASRTRAIQRSGAPISSGRGSVSGPSHSRRRASGPRAVAMAATNRSPRRYCSGAGPSRSGVASPCPCPSVVRAARGSGR
jgi:hypothetical protein